MENKKNYKKNFEKKIIMDYREKNSLVFSELIYLGIDVEIKNLDVADYIIGETIIERKTVSDFVSSMVSKRIINQLNKMNQYEKKLLIIEGIYEKELYPEKNPETNMHPNSIRGFILSIVLKHKIPLIFTKNSKDTAKFLDLLLRKKETENTIKAYKKGSNKKETLQIILESFPGIGPKNSKKLLQEFKTIKNIINSDEDSLKKIIGKKAETIKKLIDLKY